MKERLLDLYVCIVISVALRILIHDDVTYLMASALGGAVYGVAKGRIK